ncbi:MAG: hypothetical protein AAF570_16610, partial [Bacteroidota bacterium]
GLRGLTGLVGQVRRFGVVDVDREIGSRRVRPEFPQARNHRAEQLAADVILVSMRANHGVHGEAALLSNLRRLDDLEILLHKALECPGINAARIQKEFGVLHELRGEWDAAMEAYQQAVFASLVQADISRYQEAIARVEEKKSFLGAASFPKDVGPSD